MSAFLTNLAKYLPAFMAPASLAAAGAALQRDASNIDISFRLVANSTGSAAANAAAITAALNTASSAAAVSTVSINAPGVYYIQQVVVPSNVTLSIGRGVTIRKDVNYGLCMFINQGALQVAPVGDTNITFTGLGTLDGNANAQTNLPVAKAGLSANTFLYGVQGEVSMINVTDFTFSVHNVYACNGFVVQWTGQRATFRDIYCDTARDFIHINGPSSHIEITNCVGYSSDAFIALNAWDWHRSGPTVGDITDVRVRDVAYYGSNGLSVNGSPQARTSGLIIYLPGTRTTGYGQGVGNVRNVSVDGFVIDMTKGSVTPASDGVQPSMTKDTYDGTEWSGAGVIDNIWMANGYCAVPNSNCSFISLVTSNITADAQATVTIRNFVVENVHADASMGATGNNIVKAASAFNYWYVEALRFKNCQWTPTNAAGTNQAFINWALKTPAGSIVVDGLTINYNTGTGCTAAFLINAYTSGVASVVNDLTLDRITTAPGHQITTGWMVVVGVINNFRSRGNYLVGSAGGSDIQGIFFLAATGQIVNGVISDAYFVGTKEVLMLSTSASNAGRFTFRNCVFSNVTHPVYVNNAATLDVSFQGCAIDTGANLARVSNASANVTLSFKDTTSSGAGATTINLTAAGTLRVRNSDRIALPAGVAATNPPTPQGNDLINFSATPSYTGSNVILGSGAGTYIYSTTPVAGWIKQN